MRYISIIAASTFILNAVYAVNTPTSDDMNTITARRIANIISDFTVSASQVNSWEASLKSTGIWSDIDMTAGCNARTANWPAAQHLTRTRMLATAYAADPTDTTLLSKINLALNYWFDNDFTEPDCLDSGGVSGYDCPCGTPGLWNKNWFNQAIAVPQYVGHICLLIQDKLTSAQKAKCAEIQNRSYVTIDEGLRPVSSFTGANLLDVATVGISLGLLNDDPALVKDALEHFYGGVVVETSPSGDGIQADGSFMQHAGLLYNGNYGNVYMNDLISVFIETKETSVAPDTTVQDAFDVLLDGTEWMIIGDTKLKKLLWQYSTIGRMISFRYSDGQASGGVNMDIEKIEEGSEGWANEAAIDEITDRLQEPTDDTANQGNLVGTRFFWNSDYLVHRAPTYVTTMKMYSTRTVNSECLNAQNPYGFHLSDGAIFNYLTGDEYVDVFGAWNWELVPGITVDYGGTPLACSAVKTKGKKAFVGAATDGNTGIAVMDFLNPTNGNLAVKKTAFFFPSGYAVQVGPVTSKSSTAPLVTVLDQRRRNGDIYVNGALRNTDTTYATTSGSKSIWHDKIGYYFPAGEVLYVDSKPKAANWSNIGISTGTETDQLWTSYIKHSTKTTTGLLTQYIVQPDIDAATFNSNVASGSLPISLDFSASSPQVNAAYSATDKSIAVAFWTSGTYTSPWGATFQSDSPCVLLFRETATNTYRLTVTDPTHLLTSTKLTITVGGVAKSTTVTYPTGNRAGRYVVKSITY